MAGGVGSRFWPMSTSNFPKQFIDILGTGKTLIQQTFERLSRVVPKENIYVITHREYVDLTLEQLPQIAKNQVVGEPMMMNTAACNIYMAEKIYRLNPDACLVIAPSDHLIIDEAAFAEDVSLALEKVSKDSMLITLGIEPSRPDTGYGYIEYDKTRQTDLRKVNCFREKPDLQTAKTFLQSGNYLWNSGIFIWSAVSILNSFQKFLPEMYRIFKSLEVYNSEKEEEEVSKIYPQLEKISIDYGILEKSDNVWVIPSSFGWSDLGTWGALYENFDKNEDGNAVHGKQIQVYNTFNTIVRTDQEKIVIVDGLKDYIVVDTPNALLVCPRTSDQKIKDYVEDIKKKRKKEKM
jgi:mannose-1-phosphate guanylyltransferase